MTRRALIAVLALCLCGAAAPAAHAEFGIESLSAALTDQPPTPVTDPPSPAPDPVTQLTSGAHPDLRIDLAMRQQDGRVEDGGLRDVSIELPPGLTINPQAMPTCSQAQISPSASQDDGQALPDCPVDSQIGTLAFEVFGGVERAPLFNLEHPEGSPAQFGLSFFGQVVKLNGRVRSDGRYSLGADVNDITDALPVTGFRATLWGVPADPKHDAERGDPNDVFNYPPNASRAPRRALVTNPTSCTAEPQTFSATVTSWAAGTPSASSTDTDEPDGTPFRFTGCDTLPFAPTVDVAPTTTAPDSPTGLGLSLALPQSDSPNVRPSAHLRDLRLTLPAGMAVNPSAAGGLEACASAQFALSSDAAVTCPSASKLGAASIITPLLTAPLTGDVFLAKQGDNPFGTLLGLYLVVRGQNVVIKLAGRVDLDPTSGRLVTSFSGNPQLPFSRLDVQLDGGDRAPLVTPPTCGPQTATTELTPWSGTATRTVTSGFSIDCVAGLGAFTPGFGAGTGRAQAGIASPLIVNVTRPDGQAQLSGLSLSLPTGLLAKLRGVPRCGDAEADAGACDAASRVGGATAGTGAGSQPFPLTGDVFLTGPYKGAPFGLAVRVRVLAGPLDLGTVIVRQALFIDPDDTHVTVVSDPLPTILQGIPIRLRTLDVQVDRPDFVVNPTSCAAKTIGATLGAIDGRTAAQSVAFRVGGCEGLRLTPKLALALRGRQTGLRDGGHPALRALLTQPRGQSNLRTARVTLPLSLALEPDNAQALCETADGAKAEPTCPKGSIVGYARAMTPLLDKQLGGFVYFVKGERRTASGRVVRTLPTLVVPLSGDGVRITLRAKTAVSKNHLVTTFERIPDAPVSRFDLRLSGGKHGILVTNGNACKRSRKLGVAINGQNGVTVRNAPTLKAACPKRGG